MIKKLMLAVIVMLSICSMIAIRNQANLPLNTWTKGTGIGQQIDYQGGERIWIVAQDNSVWNSLDNGATWNPVGNGKAKALSAINGKIFIVGIDGYLWMYENNQWVLVNNTKKIKRVVMGETGIISVIGEDDIIYFGGFANKEYKTSQVAVVKAKEIAGSVFGCKYIDLEGKLNTIQMGPSKLPVVVNANVNLKSLSFSGYGNLLVATTQTDEVMLSKDGGLTFTSTIDAAKLGKAKDVSVYQDTYSNAEKYQGIHIIGLDNTHWHYRIK